MEPTILDQIPFVPETDKVNEALRIRPGSSGERVITALLEEAVQLARPKVMFKLAFVEQRDEQTVNIDGVQFSSKLMVRNLEDVNRVFVYVATCGRELHDWEVNQPDSLSRFYAYSINNFALLAARAGLIEHLEERFRIQKHATMNPGSLEDWPITEQRPLFQLLGDTQTSIGVELTEGYLMVPGQTVSGILFETEKDYVNCMLCPKLDCPNRRAPYEEALYSDIFD